MRQQNAAGLILDPARQSGDKHRRWTRILPAIFVTYSLAYLDRTNYAFGAAAGLARTLGITSSRAALLGALFFLGYFLFQVPAATYARKHGAKRIVFWALIAWGLLAAATGLVTNFWLLAADRLLLGIAESLVMPVMLVLLTEWFTSSERSRANTVLILGNPVTVLWMSAATGYLIHAVGWQVAFVIEGVPSVLWAFAWNRLIDDRPAEAAWMSPAAARSIEVRLQSEQQSIPRVTDTWAALRGSRVLILSLQYFFWSAGLYGFVLWLPSIVDAGAKQGIGITGLLSAVPYLAAVGCMLAVSKLSDRAGKREQFVWPFLLISGVAFFLSYWTAGLSFWLAYLFLIVAGAGMYAPYGPFYAAIPEMLPKNVSGQAMAFVNACGSLGGFAGTWLVGILAARPLGSESSFLLMATALTVSGLIMLFLPKRSVINVPLQTSRNH